VKPLAIWAPAVAAVLGVFAVVASTTRDTDQVYVVVDSSFQMRSAWTQIPDELDRIDDQRNAEFALAIEKRPIHGYQAELSLSGVDPFAPCSFDGIADDAAALDADQRILITTTDNECDISAFDDWEIIEL